MELGFFTVLVWLYKVLATIVVIFVGFFSVICPAWFADENEHPLPLLLYVFTPIILAICYKLLEWIW